MMNYVAKSELSINEQPPSVRKIISSAPNHLLDKIQRLSDI